MRNLLTGRLQMLMPALPAALLLAGMAAASLGELDADVSLQSAAEVWGDVLWDVDSLGMQVLRVRPEDEIALGDRLHRQSRISRLQSGADPALAEYVQRLGAHLAERLPGRGIPYRFYLLDSPVVNAHAGPGGHIYVHAGLVEALDSEAELAAILGHEIAHVEARHVAALFHYELALQRQGLDGLGRVSDVLRRTWGRGYRQYQELEADALGLRLLVESGYDPMAASRAMRRISGDTSRHDSISPTPLDEAARVVMRELGQYGASHPLGGTRIRRLEQQARRELARLPDGTVYDGRRNLLERATRMESDYPEERQPASAPR